MTSSALRKIEKHPHSWTFTSTHPSLDSARVTSSTFQGGGGGDRSRSRTLSIGFQYRDKFKGGDHPCHTPPGSATGPPYRPTPPRPRNPAKLFLGGPPLFKILDPPLTSYKKKSGRERSGGGGGEEGEGEKGGGGVDRFITRMAVSIHAFLRKGVIATQSAPICICPAFLTSNTAGNLPIACVLS